MDVPVRRSWVLWALLILVAATLTVVGAATPARAADGDQRAVGPRGSGAPAWTPDSSSLAYAEWAEGTTGVSLVLQRLDQTRGRLLGDTDSAGGRDPSVPQVSPDGQRVLFWNQDPDTHVSSLHILNLRDDSIVDVPYPSGMGTARDASWSPDGKRIVFSAATASPQPIVTWAPWVVGPANVYVADANGGNARPVTHFQSVDGGQVLVFCPRWSPDGATIAFAGTGMTGAMGSYGVFAVDAAGGEPRLVVERAMDLSWSPDSRRFVVTKQANPPQLAIVNLSGVQERLLTSSYADQQPAWSPDGRFIAFNRAGRVWVRSLGAAIPEAWDVPVGVSINQAALFTNSREVSVLVSPPMNATTVTLSNDGGFARSRTFRVNQLQQQIPWTLNTPVVSVLPSIVYARFTADGPHYTDDIVLDVTVPVIDGAEVAPAVSPTATRMAGSSRLTVRARDNRSGVGAIQLNSTPTPAGAVTVPYAPTRLVKGWSATSWVRVRDRAGNWSRWRLARPIPTRPTSVRWANAATTAPGTATVRWAPPVNLGFPSVVSYRVRRTGPNGSLYGPELRTTSTTVAFAGLRAGATYRVQIVAVNPTGSSTPVTVLARPTR